MRYFTVTGCLIKKDVDVHGNVLSWVIFHLQGSHVMDRSEIFNGQQNQYASNLNIDHISTINEPMVKHPPVAELNSCYV
jgi:hypothetical protein